MANNETLHNDTDETVISKTTSRAERWLSVAVLLVRIVVGVTFVISGGVKLIDPAGTMYKIDDYLAVMNLSILSPFSLVASVILSLTEFVLGINALFGSYRRLTSILLLIFIAFMTPLTFYLAVFEPIRDCGCFGDAIILSNWQTFAKNLILLALIIFLFKYNGRVRSLFHREVQSLTVLYALFYGAALAWIGCTGQPLLDFRPYKIGTDIPAALYGENIDEAEFDFIYEKNGVRQTFTIDNLPDESAGWTFVQRIERVPIVDTTSGIEHFVIYDGGDDVTDEILGQDGYLFMLFSPDLETADDDEVNRVNELYDYCLDHDYPFYAVTASAPQAIDRWLDKTGGEYRFLFMDKTAIRTIARNNPYLIILKDGVIYHKLTLSMLPDGSQLSQPFDQIKPYNEPARYDAPKQIGILLAILVVPLLLLLLTEQLAVFVVRKIKNNVTKHKSRTKNVSQEN